MISWIILVIYWGGYIIAFRKIFWVLVHDMTWSDQIERSDWAFGMLVAGFVTLFWPIVVPGYFARDYFHLLASPPKAERLKMKEKELRERERKIKELERSVGISEKDDDVLRDFWYGRK